MAIGLMIGFFGLCPQAKAQTDNEKYVVVDKDPEYPGGLEAMYRFIGENLVYPDLARDNNIQGIVHISFIVEKDGTIGNIKILRNIGGGCGEAAVDVVKKMPKWKPGEAEGKPVRVQYTLPLNFALTDPEENNEQ